MRNSRHLLGVLAVTGLLGTSLVACSSTSDGSADAAAPADMTLRTNDWNPPAHPFTTAGWEPLGEALLEATDGAVSIEHYPSEGLGAVGDTLTLLQSGIADMASTTVAYHPAEFPLLQVTAGAAWEDAALSAQAMWEMCQQEPFVSEIKAAGVVPIVCTSVSPYELFLRGNAVEGVPAAFEGKRIRATGLQGEIVSALGATATTDSSTEIYLRMEQGAIDGTTAGWYTMPALSLGEVTTDATVGLANWNAGLVMFAMSQKKWDALDDDVRETLRELGREYSLAVAEGVDAEDAEAKKDTADSITSYEVSEKERAAVRDVVSTVLDRWVTRMDAERGLGAEAQAAVDVLDSLRDLEPQPVDEWTPSAY
ncbi:hypothetical protein NQ156_01525 [Microbacterium sp. zg.Y625]|uniref:hypothetical protein n=1 Tax=Microbacterium jiangjiandongii TaxID=3049071 RepID=UPI00214C704C|nr:MULTISPECIES: hypothetical protein [unclassified Microbacterium]MCR2791740.1 hypothetical protein [Microbacterium sp. zg.Y625]MCR2816547.1 hypothetical protein [Microbacterium sp. zg.Y843]WIM24557.1 hypothetical protein QNO14_10435 [Microbacterium sp. zg-Y625]